MRRGAVTDAAHVAVVIVLSCAVLVATRSYSYLLFHTLVELVGVVICCATFVLVWNARRLVDDGFFLAFGAACLSIAVLNFAHVLFMPGMGALPSSHPEIPIQLATAGLCMTAVAFLVGVHFLGHRPKLPAVRFLHYYAAATALLVGAIFLGVFPALYTADGRPTPFKVASGLVTLAVFLGAILVLYRRRAHLDRRVSRVLVGALVTAAAGELSFVLTVEPLDLAGLIGHLCFLASFVLVYLAIVGTGTTRPYDLLYRNLMLAEARYRELFQAAPVMYVITLARNGRPIILDCNQVFLHTLGYEKSDLIGRPLGDFYTPASRGVMEDGGYQSALDGHFEVEERELVARDGRIIQTLLHAGPEIDPDGRATGTRAMFVDITRRKQAESALAESEERYRLFVQNFRGIAFRGDMDFHPVFLHGMVEELTGYSQADFAAHQLGWDRVIHPDDRHLFVKGAEILSSSPDAVLDHEYRILRKDGEVRWVQEVLQRVSDESGKPLYVQGVVYDITQRKQMELALERRVEQLAAIYAMSNAVSRAQAVEQIYAEALAGLQSGLQADRAAILLVDGEGTFRFQVWEGLSDAFVRAVDEVEPWRPSLSDEEPILIEDVTRGIASELYRAVMVREGIRALAQLPLTYGGTSGGQLAGLLAVYYDAPHHFTEEETQLAKSIANHISFALERTRTEQAEREQRRLAEALRDTAAALASTLGLDEVLERILAEVGRVVPHDAADVMLVEDGVARIVRCRGYDKMGVGETVFAVRYTVKDTMNLRIIAETGRPLAIPDTRKYPDWLHVPETDWLHSHAGAPIHVKGRVVGFLNVGSATPGFYNQGHAERLKAFADQASAAVERAQLYEAIRGHSQELEQRVAARTKELSLANLELAHAAHMKDEFLANMSHELRTPLNAVLGISEALREQIYGTMNERQLRSLQVVDESGRHLLSLINDMLDLSKIGAGKFELQLDTVDVVAVGRASLQFVSHEAQKKRISVSSTFDSRVVAIQADERRVKQILVNLLSNAVKFTPSGGAMGLEMLGDPERKAVQFTVWDTGIGIPPEGLEGIFQPFVQLDSGLARQQGGTGLGLTLVKRMAEMHGGDITVQSTPGQGSRFTVTLPWQGTPLGTEPVPALAAQSTLDRFEGRSALLIEDAAADSEQMMWYLTELGLKVTLHTQGRGAVSVAQTLDPHVILLDILLPDPIGWDILAQLHANPRTRTIPVIVVSALDDAPRSYDLGAIEHLTKPIDRARLQAALAKALEGRVTPPVVSAPPAAAAPVQAAAPDPPLILLADDNVNSAFAVIDYLQIKGYRLELARDGEEAVRLAASLRPALILMDVQMPGMDGLEAIRCIRQDPMLAATPILALTALAMPGDNERCLAAGADGYISKPIALRQLAATLERELNRKRKA